VIRTHPASLELQPASMQVNGDAEDSLQLLRRDVGKSTNVMVSGIDREPGMRIGTDERRQLLHGPCEEMIALDRLVQGIEILHGCGAQAGLERKIVARLAQGRPGVRRRGTRR
jgi:hypothetical protein